MGKKHLYSLTLILKESELDKDAIVNCDETWCEVRRFNKYTTKYMWMLVNKVQGFVPSSMTRAREEGKY